MRSLVAAMLVAVLGCGHAPHHVKLWPDAPLQLRDDADRDQAIDQLWVLDPGPRRDEVRASIVDALARRISDALEEDQPFVAEALLFQLAGLWQTDPQTVGPGLAGHGALLERLRATFAKSGAIEPTICTLALLVEVAPPHRAERLAELDEVLRFADDLAAAENGPEAQRAQPIALLQPTVLALPLPWIVDRYVGLLEERQRVVANTITSHGASIQLVRAHHDITATSQRIAIALARAGRTEEISRHLQAVSGLIGTDKALEIRAEVVAEQPTADAYYELALAIRTDEKNGDPGASLAVSLAGLAKYPRDVGLLVAAAGDAQALGRVDQPIALYETALAAAHGDVDSALALRLGKLYSQRIARLAFGGRPGAATTAWNELARTTSHRTPEAAWAVVAATGQTALGKGLLSQGQLDLAEHALVASLDRAPSIDAYETLATIYYKTDRLASASRYASAGLALLGESRGDHVRRAKLERIAADVARTAGKTRDAATLYLDSMRTWAGLGDDKDLPRGVAAERKLEAGRAMWYLGDSGRSVDLVFAAIDADPDSAVTCAGAAAFMLQVGRFADAVDAVHRGLSSSDVTELYKVYMSLWILADGHHRGEPRDRQAYEYLASRHGDLWYEQLAEAATGRLDVARLRAAAITGPRRSELAFYGVALGLDPDAATPAGARRLLAQVVDAHLVMDAEYDLARQYLAEP